MTEMDASAKPPQISEMFHKFALAFKSKTIEFFAEDEDQEPDPETIPDDSDDFTLLDSTEDFITNQRVVVIKPDSAPNKPTPFPKHLHPSLIASLFATLSSFEASYLQLQTAHSPFDASNIEAADRSAVSHLKKLSELKNWYKDYSNNNNNNPNPSFLLGSPLEAQVQENQSILRTLEMLFNGLQSEIDVKDTQVLMMKRKLKAINDSNSKLSKRFSDFKTNSATPQYEVFLSITVFDKVLRYACKLTHRFTKLLIHLMKKVGWDLDSAANSVYSNVEYAKTGHNRYAFLSYISLGMFQGFDLEKFELEEEEEDEVDCNGIELKRDTFLRQFVEHGTGDALEILRNDPNGCFAKFCEKKYQQLIHPTMESSLFKNLEQNELMLSCWRSSTAALYESFVEMSSSIWMLHKLAFAFDPTVEIFQVDRGVDFSMVYMESVTGKGTGKAKAKVGFTVIPGFKVGKTVIQSQVYLSSNKWEE